jgi:hypothetical protein
VKSFAAAARRGTALAGAVAVALALSPAGAPAQPRPSAWATINACDPPDAPGIIGVRVMVPNRRNAAQWVRIRIQFFDGTAGAWRVVRSGGDGGFAKLSNGGKMVMGGTTFTFSPPQSGRRLLLRGLVDVQWRRGRRVLSTARVLTRGGHVDPNDPLLQVSSATCQITP